MCVQDQTHLFCVKHDLPLSLTPPALVSPGAFIKAARRKQIDASKQGKTEPDGGSGERDPYPSLTEEDGEKELLLFLGTMSGVRVKNTNGRNEVVQRCGPHTIDRSLDNQPHESNQDGIPVRIQS